MRLIITILIIIGVIYFFGLENVFNSCNRVVENNKSSIDKILKKVDSKVKKKIDEMKKKPEKKKPDINETTD